MYKFKKSINNEIYDTYVKELSVDDILDAEVLNESVDRRLFNLSVLRNGAPINPTDISSFTYDMDMGVDDWTIGLTPYKTLTLGMINRIEMMNNANNMTGSIIQPTIGLQVLNEKNEKDRLDVPYGTYIVDSVKKDLSVSTLTCYDQLYYMSNTDCDFDKHYGEEHENGKVVNTVGNILNTLTKKYASNGVVELSDAYKGDFTEYWNDILPQPKVYKEYSAPPEEPVDEGLPDDDTPIEDEYPQDPGQDDGYIPSVELGSYGNIILTTKTIIMFEEETEWVGVKLSSQPYDKQEVEITLNNDSCTVSTEKLVFTKDDYDSEQLVEITGVHKRNSTEDRQTVIKFTTPYVSEKTLTVVVRNIDNEKPVSTQQLMEDYWGGKRKYAADFSGWDPTIKGGGFYKDSDAKLLATEHCYITIDDYNLYDGSVDFIIRTGDPDGVNFSHYGSGGYYNHYSFRSCEPFNTYYAVLKITFVDERLGDSIEVGLKVKYAKDGTRYLATSCSELETADIRTNDNSGVTEEYDIVNDYGESFSFVISEPGSYVSVPNFFLDENSYYTDMSRSYGYRSIFFRGSCVGTNGEILEKEVIEELASGITVATFDIEYYGKKELTSKEYDYIMDGWFGDSRYINYGDYYVAGSYRIGAGEIYNNNIYHYADCYDPYIYPIFLNNVIDHESQYWPGDPISGDLIQKRDGFEYEEDTTAVVTLKAETTYEPTVASSPTIKDIVTAMSEDVKVDENGNIIAEDVKVQPVLNSEGKIEDKTPQLVGAGMKEAELLGYIAGYCGGNIVLDHNNEFRLVKLSRGKDNKGNRKYDKLYPPNLVAMPTINDCEASAELGGIIVHTSESADDDIESRIMKYPSQGVQTFIIDVYNPFLLQNEKRLEAIYNEMVGIKYYPINIVVQSDPRLWLGDIVKFERYVHKTDDGGVEVIKEGYYPIMQLSGSFDGALSNTIETTCQNQGSRLDTYKGNISSEISNLSSSVKDVGKAVSKVAADIEEIRILVAYINKLFAIEVNADNIVTSTLNTQNVRISSGGNAGIYIDGSNMDWIDDKGKQRIHIGEDLNTNEYYIKLTSPNGYYKTISPTEGSVNQTESASTMSVRSATMDDLYATIENLQNRITELENKNESEGE